MKRFNALNDYLKTRFGKKMYKLAVDGGFSCPNRDGTKGTGGCIFCSVSGSGDFAERGKDIKVQLENARKRIENKLPPDCGFIAYFQSFTNTYAPVEILRSLFESALDTEGIEALSIATRPDCINAEKAALLAELNAKKPVFVELGLQTSNEETAHYISRCYPNSDFTKAVRLLRENGIEVIVHMIIGLPGETEKDILSTVKFISAHDVQGVKLQLLHVLKNTRLAETDYTPLEKDEYYELLGKCLEHLRPDIIIHRLTGDGDKRQLIAPMWSADKHRVLNGFMRYMDEHDIVQGRKYQ